MDGQKILVPYNFTGNDEKSIDLVIQTFGQRRDAEITLFHAYVPVPDIDISNKTVMVRIGENLNFLRQKIDQMEAEIMEARGRLLSAGFDEKKVSCVFRPQKKDAAQDIIEFAREGRFTAIVLNRSPGSVRKFFTPSVSKKVNRALQNLKLYMVG